MYRKRLSVILYLTGLCMIFGLKYRFRQADCGDLRWLLAPTAWWVRMLSGISFTWNPALGYVSHTSRFIIAASCSGIQFFIITFAALLFSFLHRMDTARQKSGWLLFCLFISYPLTVAANGLRIVLSIRLPALLSPVLADAAAVRLTPERLHTEIGMAVYFSALLFFCRAADNLFLRRERKVSGKEKNAGHSLLIQWLLPASCYLILVLGVPFLNHAAQNDPDRFYRFARLVLTGCLSISGIYLLLFLGTNYFSRRPRS